MFTANVLLRSRITATQVCAMAMANGDVLETLSKLHGVKVVSVASVEECTAIPQRQAANLCSNPLWKTSVSSQKDPHRK